jgi:TatD DNase family protein
LDPAFSTVPLEVGSEPSEAQPLWVDSHCHLQLFDQAPELVLGRAPHVDWMVAPGLDLGSSRVGLGLADQFESRVFAAVGMHPDHADRWGAEGGRILELIPQAIAVGETGLDFYRNLAPRDVQMKAFRALLEAAVAYRKPVIVHCRDAFQEVYDLIIATGCADLVIMHCWSGGPKWARRFVDLGVMFSFAGPLLFGRDDMIRRGAGIVGPTRSLVETDAPHLCPPRRSDQHNEPASVGLVGAALAVEWQMTCAEVASITSRNAHRCFLGGRRHIGR